MHLLPWAEDSEAELRWEVEQSLPGALVELADARSGTCMPSLPGGLVVSWSSGPSLPLPHLAFARQLLPDALPVRAGSIRDWAGRLFAAVAETLPDDQPWSLHVEPHYGAREAHRIGARAWHSARLGWRGEGRGARLEAQPERNAQPDANAGRHRCRLIREALVELLQRRRRHLLRQLRRQSAPFTPKDSLVQLLLTSPDVGFISTAIAPLPFDQRHLVSPFPKGEVPVAADKTAPSRAFAKLVETELRLGRSIQSGETCVDMGASPGSWTYVAVSRGARVIAVDRSPLRDDLMVSRQVEFQRGDAFRYQPSRPVDWLLCDVIAAPERTAELLLEWLRRGWCRHFVVTLKVGKGQMTGGEWHGAEVLAMLKRELPPLTSELYLTRLCANKHEVCAFGSASWKLQVPRGSTAP
jgi:23S rRNA (cytidine2498-2'-O)-methyltransferase